MILKAFSDELQKIAAYREGQDSTFTHDKQRYSVDLALKASRKKPVIDVPLKDLTWILRYGKPQAGRKRNADTSVPILVTNWYGKKAVVDGYHRLSKAKKQNLETIPARVLTKEDLATAKLQELNKKTLK